MKTIYKYPIEITDEQFIDIPRDHEIIRAGLDPAGHVCIWAEIDKSSPTTPVGIYVLGTGHPVPDNAVHLGSFVQIPFVWHVYTNK